MTRLLALTIVCFSFLSCDSTEPYVHEPKFDKNVSTLYAYEKDAPDGMTPDFTWKDSNGVLRSFKDLQGKIVLVNFWATWCAPCLVEMPALNDIAKDFAVDSVVVIGISIDQSGNIYPKVEEFHRNKRLVFQVISDPEMRVYEAYMGTRQISIPQTFVIDRDGALYTQMIGEQQYDSFAERIRDLL